ncbi:MAG: hypothetical protein RL375_3966 [Pseudomonadota bacterium]|jgi:hypothetical protein
MSYAYGGELLAGAYGYGAPGLGVLAELIAADGLAGPGYAYGAVSLPADNGREISAVITRWPTLGTLTVYPDFSFDYVGATDYALYQLRVDGVDSTTDIGYGPGVGRFELVVGAGDGGTLSGNVAADAALAAGALASDGPSSLGGNVTADPATAGGSMVGDITGVLPPMGAGMRTIKAGRLVPTKLAPLDVAEVDNLTADMSTVLGNDDPIVDVLITCEDRVGTDPAETPLLYGDWQVQGPLVRQRIQGVLGVLGVTYLLRVQATATSGKVAVATAFIKVVRLA